MMVVTRRSFVTNSYNVEYFDGKILPHCLTAICIVKIIHIQIFGRLY